MMNKNNTKSLGGGRRSASLSSKCMVAFGTFSMLLGVLRLVNLMLGTPLDKAESHSTIKREEALVKKKRWAVMMIGSARTYAFARSSFIKNVLNQTDPPMAMDVFTSTQSMNNSSCSIEKHSLGLLEKDSTAVRFNQVNFTVQKGTQGELKKTRDRFLDEQNALLQLIENYSKEHDITYDYIFYTRPDLHYTTPFNILAMERAIKGNKSTIFSPGCCKFAGWCDRLGASSYQDFSTMIVSTEDWMRSGGDKYTYETAFQKRAEYANLTRFDLTPKKDYGFHTLRFKYASQSCNGVTKWEGAHWTDMLCNDMITPDLETTPASCTLLNNSNSCNILN